MKEQIEVLIRELDNAAYQASIDESWETQSQIVAIKMRLRKLQEEVK